MNKLAKGVIAIAGGVTAALFGLTPAQAAVVPDGLGFIDTQTCKDQGGIPYTVSVDWNYKYVDAAGVTRVSVNPLVIKRDDADAGAAADAGVDLYFDVYSNSVNIQHKFYDGLDLDFAADDQASFNPRNPRSNADDTDDPTDTYSSIRVKVGTDGDGLDNCPWLTFRQPENIQFRPAT